MGSLLFFAPPAPHGARFAVPVHGTACSLVYHISKLTLRVPLVFTKKQGIYAAKLMLRLRLAFANRTYYTMTPRSGPNKTARAAVLHGSMFSKPCALAQGRVPCTRAAAQAATLRLLYHNAVSAAIIKLQICVVNTHSISQTGTWARPQNGNLFCKTVVFRSSPLLWHSAYV